MADPRVLNGIEIANEIKREVAAEVARLQGDYGLRPGLAAVLVGQNPASEVYVRSKVRTCRELGLASDLITPPATATTHDLLKIVAELNARNAVDGILVQLPLPEQVDSRRVLNAVLPEKDVDGFHPVNAGRLQTGQPALAPCTPAGVIEILKRSNIPIAGANAVVIGRSDIVGKPQAILLLQNNATVTIAHSRTRDLAEHTLRADIVVAAIGRAGFLTRDMVRPGATLIDVGINRITDQAEFDRLFTPTQPDYEKRVQQFREKGSVLVGDIHPDAFAIAGAYTPVPGGVGPLTIAMLMSNTVKAARLRRGITA